MEIDYTQNAEEYGQLLFEKHRLEKLKELATNWNDTSNKPNNLINTNTNDWLELTCELFLRKYKPPIEITFPEPYYSIFYNWSLQDPDEEKSKHLVLELYKCNNYIIDYLFYSLVLPIEKYVPFKKKEKLELNLERFNKFWIKLDVSNKIPIKNYNQFRNILISNKLSILDLIYIVLECDNYFITYKNINMYMLLDRAQKPINLE